jgi:hypothetical protein
MRVKVTKNEVDVIARETGLLKFRILSEMVVWTPNLRTLKERNCRSGLRKTHTSSRCCFKLS